MGKNIDSIKSRLTPFDAETILMIKSVTGHEPEITEKAESFELKMYVKDKDEYIIKAAIDAVIGRYGLRMRAVKHIWEQMFLRGATFFVEYEKGAENLPDEVHADNKEPNEKAGHLYCHRLLEVRAVVVSRDNIERLIDFTGGGTMEIPRKPGGIAQYSFVTENGVIMSVPERWAVVRFPDGRFGKMDYKTFVEEFEEMDDLEKWITKIAGREKTPEFMRKHPHKEPESPVCGNCSNFENEDTEGGGFCNEQNRMRHCSCIACNQWQERQTAGEYKQFERRFNAIK